MILSIIIPVLFVCQYFLLRLNFRNGYDKILSNGGDFFEDEFSYSYLPMSARCRYGRRLCQSGGKSRITAAWIFRSRFRFTYAVFGVARVSVGDWFPERKIWYTAFQGTGNRISSCLSGLLQETAWWIRLGLSCIRGTYLYYAQGRDT